jgi:hypothetical protein
LYCFENLYPNQISSGISVYKILVGKPERMRPLGRPRHRWEDNISMDLWEIGFGGVDWVHLAQDRERWWAVMNIMNLHVPLASQEGFFSMELVT